MHPDFYLSYLVGNAWSKASLQTELSENYLLESHMEFVVPKSPDGRSLSGITW